MTEQIRDPELDRLVRELNRRGGAPAAAEPDLLPGSPESPAVAVSEAAPRSALPDVFDPWTGPPSRGWRRADRSTACSSR